MAVRYHDCCIMIAPKVNTTATNIYQAAAILRQLHSIQWYAKETSVSSCEYSWTPELEVCVHYLQEI